MIKGHLERGGLLYNTGCLVLNLKGLQTGTT